MEFDPEALTYQETKYGNYLSEGVPVQPIVNQHSGTVQLAALSLPGISSNGDGTLATLKFKVNAIKGSKLSLRDVVLSNNEGNKSYAWIEGTQLLNSAIAEGCATFNIKDVNKDCVINIQDLVLVATHFGRGGESVADVNSDGRVDIIDLVLVAGAFGDTAAAPTVYADTQTMITTADVQQWLREAHKVNLTDFMYQRGMVMLEQLLTVLTPKNTALLPNYPNPFNPETWIPYQLAVPAEVTVFIYSANGTLIRTFALGYQPAGVYRSRDRAAYWNGTNGMGESVASGVYFYTLSAGEFKATRKMLIIK
ncbi:MAG: T9SS type A sorting domain-containing protein [Candidatus Poribacteria bacterium]|nr:T9SS type A sorting domain-containing protein [Candidatus Poribacteria bacterium]